MKKISSVTISLIVAGFILGMSTISSARPFGGGGFMRGGSMHSFGMGNHSFGMRGSIHNFGIGNRSFGMVRKLNLIIIALISIFLMPLPVYARGGGHGGHGGFSGHGGFGGHNGFGHGGFHAGHFDHGHFHHHHEHFEEDFLFASGLFLGFDLAAIIPLAVYPYYYPPCCGYYPYYEYPYGQPYGDLEILVTPEDAEIYVDGRFIGKAKDFSGPTMVSVASGTHIVEFRYNGLSSSTSVTVAPDSKSVVQQHFSNNPKNSV